MKRIVLLAFCVLSFSAFSQAQNVKFGHINTSELISLMSERDSALVKLMAYENDLQETLEGMGTEYNNKVNEYQRKQNEWAPVVLETKQRELQELGQRIQQFQQNAQQEMAQMQQTLMTPVIDKAQDAVTKVAKAQGLTYVFDLSSGSLIYYDEAVSVNLLPLVKKELGIPANKVAPTQLQNTTPNAQ
ncbi:MAG: OmpH family outer membrane protein [Bacteroidales bacterium]|nr:OmpH family outer membrane protein [Bacteroidales bacterium]